MRYYLDGFSKPCRVIHAKWNDHETYQIMYKNWGMVRVSMYDDTPNIAAISDLYVIEGKRHNGLGYALLELAMEIGFSIDSVEYLELACDMEISPWYKTLGWQHYSYNEQNLEILRYSPLRSL